MSLGKDIRDLRNKMDLDKEISRINQEALDRQGLINFIEGTDLKELQKEYKKSLPFGKKKEK